MIPSFAVAQTAPADPQAALTQQMQKIMGHKNPQQALGQAMVVGTLLGCTQQKSGKEATQALYKDLETIGKTAEAYCKQGQPAQARALIVSTIEAKHNDPVVQNALTCYDQQSAGMGAMGGPEIANNLAHYVRWMRDPSLVRHQVKESDICKNAKMR